MNGHDIDRACRVLEHAYRDDARIENGAELEQLVSLDELNRRRDLAGLVHLGLEISSHVVVADTQDRHWRDKWGL